MSDTTRSWYETRNVPGTLDVFTTHFPRFPVLPGVLLLGWLTGLAARELHRHTGHAWRPAGYERVKFRRYVRPGDRVDLAVHAGTIGTDLATARATVHVAGHLVATAGMLTFRAADGGSS